MSTQFSSQFVEQVPSWSSYLDLQDTKTYMQFPSTDTTRDQTLQDLIDAACYWVQDYLGRPIAPTLFFRRFDGWTRFTGAYLALPYYPVLKIVSLVEWWGSNGPQTLTQQIPENQAGGTQVYQLDALRGVVTRSFSGLVARPWFPGVQNIEVEWWAGYNPIPPTLRFATRELVKYWWVNTQQVSRSFSPKGSDYGGDIDPHNTLWPSVPNRVNEMLQPFVQLGLA